MIAIWVSSVEENMRLALTLKEQLDELNQASVLVNLVDLQFPLYTSLEEKENGLPDNISDLVTIMKQSTGFICVAPEYNGSTPPVLSNTIAWLSRTDKDFRMLFDAKWVVLATHSGSMAPGLLQAMRSQFVKLGSIVLSRDIITTYDKTLNRENVKIVLKQLIDLIARNN